MNFDARSNSDHYSKGSWILHTLRHHINSDELWFSFLRQLYETFKYQNIVSEDIFNFSSEFFKMDLNPFFEQYLMHPQIPKLAYESEQRGTDLYVRLKWESQVPDFRMGLKFGKAGQYEYHLLNSENWTEVLLKDMTSEDLTFASHQFLFEMP